MHGTLTAVQTSPRGTQARNRRASTETDGLMSRRTTRAKQQRTQEPRDLMRPDNRITMKGRPRYFVKTKSA